MIVAEKEKHVDIIYGKLSRKIDADLQMWILSHQVYESVELPRVLKRCKKIFIWTLIAAFTNRSMILRDLSYPAFPRLRVLNLESNHIHNLGFIDFIQAPQLTHLYLGHNIFSTVRAIRKTHLPNLTVLSLSYNHIQSFNQMTQCNFMSLCSLDCQKNAKITSILPVWKFQLSQALKFVNFLGFNLILKAPQVSLLSDKKVKFQNNDIHIKIEKGQQ